MNVSLRQTGDLVTPSLRRKLAAVRDKRPYLSAMGLTVVQIARRAFTDASLRPSRWAPILRPDRPKEHNPLLLTGSLRASLRVLSVDGNAVHVGTDRKYGIYHQLGKGRMLRPFFPFDTSGKATPRAAEAVRRALEARLRARMGA